MQTNFSKKKKFLRKLKNCLWIQYIEKKNELTDNRNVLQVFVVHNVFQHLCIISHKKFNFSKYNICLMSIGIQCTKYICGWPCRTHWKAENFSIKITFLLIFLPETIFVEIFPPFKLLTIWNAKFYVTEKKRKWRLVRVPW